MIQFTHPATILLAGPSFSGKTSFAIKVIQELKRICTVPKFNQILWCVSETSSIPLEIKDLVTIHKGIPDFRNEKGKPKLIILDDLMNDVYGRQVSDLFTKHSHHRNLSVILITQNLFHKGNCSRDITLNTKYIVVFKNPRDKTQFSHLARQVYPEDSTSLHKAFLDATSKPFGYLLLDLCQETHDLLRFRGNIFDQFPTVYAPTCDEKIEIE